MTPEQFSKAVRRSDNLRLPKDPKAPEVVERLLSIALKAQNSVPSKEVPGFKTIGQAASDLLTKLRSQIEDE